MSKIVGKYELKTYQIICKNCLHKIQFNYNDLINFLKDKIVCPNCKKQIYVGDKCLNGYENDVELRRIN